MSFEFVNVTSGHRRHNSATMRRIRAQVMRDYRRRATQRTPSTQSEAASTVSRASRHLSTSEEGSSSARRRRSRSGSGTSGDASPPLSPLLSEDDLRQMCTEYHHWLQSYAGQQTNAVDIVDAPWRSPASDSLLFALCLESTGHLDSLYMSHSTISKEQETRVKIRLLELINERLQGEQVALQDETLAVLGCLISYEISRGSSEASVHLRGIGEMLKLRDHDQHPQGLSGLRMMLEILDVLHAVTFCTETIFVEGANRSHRYGTAQHQNMLASEKNWWHRLLLETKEGLESRSGNQALAHPITLALNLYHLASDGVPFSLPTPQSLGDELFSSITSIPDELRAKFEISHFRVLLTALALCTKVSQKSWCFSQLSRMLYHTDSDDWNRIKSIILRFVDVNVAFWTTFPQSGVVLINGVEMVNSPAAQARARDVDPWDIYHA